MDPALVPMFLQAIGMRFRNRWSRTRLLEYQRRELRELRIRALAGSPFYRRYHGVDPDRPFETLPSLTKAQAMEAFDEIVIDPRVRLREVQAHVQAGDARLFRGRYRVVLTSGTTGQPGIFVFDRWGWIAMLAAYARSGEVAGCRMRVFRRLRTAAVASAHPTSVSHQLSSSFSSWWVPVVTLDALDPLVTVVARLNAMRPEMLIAYTSSARAGRGAGRRSTADPTALGVRHGGSAHAADTTPDRGGMGCRTHQPLYHKRNGRPRCGMRGGAPDAPRRGHHHCRGGG